jgi:hypothetical protein
VTLDRQTTTYFSVELGVLLIIRDRRSLYERIISPVKRIESVTDRMQHVTRCGRLCYTVVLNVHAVRMRTESVCSIISLCITFKFC